MRKTSRGTREYGRAAFLAALLVVAGLGVFVPPHEADAAMELKAASQACNSGKISVQFTWRRTPSIFSPYAWLDLSLYDNNWEEGSYISSSSTTLYWHTWDGLMPDSDHYIRLNELLPDGSTISTPTLHFKTERCSMEPAGFDVVLTFLGFSSQEGASEASVTPSGGTLSLCGPARLYAYIKVSSLTFLNGLDFTWYFNGNPLERPRAVFTVSTDRIASFQLPLLDPGPLSGIYGFKLKSGSGAEAEGSIRLVC